MKNGEKNKTKTNRDNNRYPPTAARIMRRTGFLRRKNERWASDPAITPVSFCCAGGASFCKRWSPPDLEIFMKRTGIEQANPRRKARMFDSGPGTVRGPPTTTETLQKSSRPNVTRWPFDSSGWKTKVPEVGGTKLKQPLSSWGPVLQNLFSHRGGATRGRPS